MEDAFIDFLNSLGSGNIGTWLAVIIGGTTVIGLIVTAILKVKKKYDTHLTDKLKKEEEDKKFKDKMLSIVTQVDDIKTSVSTLQTQHETFSTEINSKLEDVWTAVIESQRDSKEGDIALENQMKNYETAIDSLNVKLSTMDEKTTLLIESDKEGIKSFIIDKYYQALDDKYIKLHVLQGLEVRYEKYLQENGNTYIGRLMNEIREMPNEKPTQARPKTINDRRLKRRL